MNAKPAGGGIPPQGDVAKEFLLAEYSAYHEAFAKNEELGERRVQFFLGLVTAAVGAAALFLTAEKGLIVRDPNYITWSVFGLTGLLLMAGLLTYDRVLKRDETTKEYQAVLDEVRKRFKRAADTVDQRLSLEGYDPFPKPPTKRLNRLGRLGLMVLAINAWLAALAAVVLAIGLIGWPADVEGGIVLVCCAILAAIMAAIGQQEWWRANYRPPRRAEARPEGS